MYDGMVNTSLTSKVGKQFLTSSRDIGLIRELSHDRRYRVEMCRVVRLIVFFESACACSIDKVEYCVFLSCSQVKNLRKRMK